MFVDSMSSVCGYFIKVILLLKEMYIANMVLIVKNNGDFWGSVFMF